MEKAMGILGDMEVVTGARMEEYMVLDKEDMKEVEVYLITIYQGFNKVIVGFLINFTSII